MKFIFKHAFLLLGLYSNAYAECKNPFDGLTGRFLLQEKLDCNALQERVTLRIGKPSEADSFKDIGPTSYFLKPVCTGQIKSVNLNYNSDQNEIIMWGDVRGSNQESFFITPTCNKLGFLAIMSAYQRQLNLNGKELQVGFTSQPPLEYVLESENSANEVTLRSSNGTVLAHAKKTFVNGMTCYANWDVNYTNTDPTIISYILAWKDNSNLNCSTPPPTPSVIVPGAAVLITGAIFIGAASVAAALFIFKDGTRIGDYLRAYERIND